MKNYYKAIGLSLTLTLLGPLQALALSDVTLDSGGNAVINVAGINLTLSPAAIIDSVQVDSTNFTVTLSTNGSMTIVSTDRRTMSFSQPVGQTRLTTVLTCTTSSSSYAISNPTSGATNLQITVTPDSGTCSTSGGGSGSSGSGSTTGGGGGGNPYAAAPVTTPAPVAKTPAVSTTPAAVVATPAPAAAKSPVFEFKTLFKVGQSHPDIKKIQQVLNSDPDTKISASGAGSPGKETEFLGPLSIKAIQKLQVKYKIANPGGIGYGVIGPNTRAKLTELYNKLSGTGAVAVTSTEDRNAQLRSQIAALLAEIQRLQALLKAMQQ